MTPSDQTRARAVELLNYDPSTGDFTWKARKPRSPFQVGDVAGGINGCGYRFINFDGRSFLAHRLAWLIVHGGWPGLVDHMDGDRQNNAITNLRDASKTVNGQNQRKPQAHNTTGRLGVTKRKGAVSNPFQACIRAGGRLRYIGVFPTAEAAGAAYLEAKRKLQEGCTL